MDMEVGDFLPQTIVDRQLVVVGDTQLVGNEFGRVKANLESFRRSVLEIGVLFFRDDEKVHRGFGAVVGDDDDLVSLVENLGGQFSPDYAGEDGRHERKILAWTLNTTVVLNAM